MSFDAFQAEKDIIGRGEALLSNGEAIDFRKEYGDLLKSYAKLSKSSQRLVKLSDRTEEGLKEANTRIQQQQMELEKTHKKLEEHALLLEEKVRDRTKELLAAQVKLQKLVELGIALSMERNHSSFMEMILRGAKDLTNADGAVLFTLNDDDRLHHEIVWYDTLDLRMGGNFYRKVPFDPIPLHDEEGRPRYFDMVAHAALTERTVNVAGVQDSKDFDFADVLRFDATQGYRSHSFLVVPLKPRKGNVIGILLLVNARATGTGRLIAFTNEMAVFIEALASQAAVALDNRNLMEAQTRLFDSVVKVLAGAIDAKSPYTGGHCERVPELGMMLLKAACEAEDGVFADFDLDASGLREFQLAGWLHDCGKVTTPEYVVDKATKLETIYNRIHEIRTRFEVKWRDYRIDYLEALARPGADPGTLGADLDAKLAQLKDDFEFIARCNIGDDFMDAGKTERLKAIGAISWDSHFDERIGLSRDELLRFERTPPRSLPAKEYLLSDKQEHLIRRRKENPLPYDPEQYGFKIKVPKHLFNLGEIYNLCIPRGTLTEEERFKINEHTIYCIIMLDQLPFPRQLSRVPEIAGSHHETMIGTGYPRKLDRESMSIQARILAIADIFEALTASDRPYKKAKTIKEALRIMSFMRNDQQIDSDLFDLFLVSGVYRVYADKYLMPSQVESVDINQFMSKLYSTDGDIDIMQQNGQCE